MRISLLSTLSITALCCLTLSCAQEEEAPPKAPDPVAAELDFDNLPATAAGKSTYWPEWQTAPDTLRTASIIADRFVQGDDRIYTKRTFEDSTHLEYTLILQNNPESKMQAYKGGKLVATSTAGASKQVKSNKQQDGSVKEITYYEYSFDTLGCSVRTWPGGAGIWSK